MSTSKQERLAVGSGRFCSKANRTGVPQVGAVFSSDLIEVPTLRLGAAGAILYVVLCLTLGAVPALRVGCATLVLLQCVNVWDAIVSSPAELIGREEVVLNNVAMVVTFALCIGTVMGVQSGTPGSWATRATFLYGALLILDRGISYRRTGSRTQVMVGVLGSFPFFLSFSLAYY